jgi:hypothetical protein
VFVALVTIGVLLIVFGGLVLLLFPDRPGGQFEFRGAVVQSVGAGLPLIVLGVVTVIIGATQSSPEPAGSPFAEQPAVTTSPPTTTTGNPPPPDTSGPAPSPAAPPSDPPGACLEAFLEQEPRVNPAFQKLLPEGQTVKVQSGIAFALILTEDGQTTGAIRFNYEGVIGKPLVTVYDVVDASCQPGEHETQDAFKAIRVLVTLPDRRYEVTISFPEHPIYPQATLRRL